MTTILAKTPDGRPTKITISPQNALTNVKVEIGPVHLGDEELSRDLLRRISLNFGTLMRAYTPIDTTLPKRFNASRFVPVRGRRQRANPVGRRGPAAQREPRQGRRQESAHG